MTDFGLRDPYVGIMKGVIKKVAPASEIIDLTHDIPPQNVRTAHFVLRHSCRHFPDGTIFVCVVDPGVGTDRRTIAVRAAGHYFVGPDNGIFSFLCDKGGEDRQVIQLTNADYFYMRNPSGTFDGRDIFAPVAAHIDKGAILSDMGDPVDDIVVLPIDECIDRGEETDIPLLHVDRFGNMIFAMTREQWETKTGGKEFSLSVGSHHIERISDHYDEDTTLVALYNSYGLLEIAAPSKNAAHMLCISGDSQPVKAVLRVRSRDYVKC